MLSLFPSIPRVDCRWLAGENHSVRPGRNPAKGKAVSWGEPSAWNLTEEKLKSRR